jgi:hypothetical protein
MYGRNFVCFFTLIEFDRQTQVLNRKYVTSRCIVVLFGTSLPEYALINCLRRASNDFDEE